MAGTVSATIRINDAFSGALNKLKSGVSGSAGALSRLSGSAGKTGGMFKSVLGGTVIGNGITQGIAAIGSGLHGLLTTMDENSKAWQTFDGNMAMIGRSKSNIASVKGELQDFAHKTIYSASDMANTYGQLAAVGTKNTTALVKGFGGLAAAADDPKQAMKSLSQQAVQMAALPKVKWADLRIMMQQAPVGITQVAKAMHKSTGQLIADVQAGKVKTQDFLEAMAKVGSSGHFQKLATQYKTVGQALDGMVETVSDKLGAGYQSASQVAIAAISGITDKLSGMNFKPFTKIATSAMTGVVSAAKTAGKLIGDAMKNVSKMDPSVLKNLGLAFAALKAGTTGLALGAIVAGLKILGTLKPSTLNKLAIALTALAASLALYKALKGIGSVIGGIKGAFSGLGGLGKTKVSVPDGKSAGKSALGFLKLGAALALIGGAVLLAGAGMYLLASAAIKLASAGWPAIAMLGALVVVLVVIAVAAAFFAPALLAAGIALAIFGAGLLVVGIAIVIVAAGMLILSKALPAIATYGLQAALSIAALGLALFVFGTASIIAAVGLLLLGVGLAIVGIGFLVAAVGATLFGVAMLVVAIGVTIAAVGMLIIMVALPLIAIFATVAAVGMLLLGVALVIVAAVALIAGLGFMIFALALVIAAPLMLVAAVGALLLGVAMIVLGAGLLVVGVALLVVAAGLYAVISAVTAMVTAFVSGVQRLVSAVTGAMTGVVNAVRSGIQSAVSAAQSFGGALVAVGRQLIQGLVNGVKSMIGAAVGAVRSAASSVVNAAKSVLHIGSPSKLFHQYGVWVVQGLANGLDANNNAQLASARMAQGVVDAASGLNDMSLTSPGDMLASGFNRAHAAVNDVASAMRGLGGSPLTVNGQLNGTASTVPADTAFGATGSSPYTTNNSTATTQNNAGNSITIAPGAIQISSTGNAKYDIETLVSEFEDYLMNLNERKG